MVQVRYDYEEVVPSVAGGGFGIEVSGSNVSAPYEMVSVADQQTNRRMRVNLCKRERGAAKSKCPMWL